jgi:hypothetical protein
MRTVDGHAVRGATPTSSYTTPQGTSLVGAGDTIGERLELGMGDIAVLAGLDPLPLGPCPSGHLGDVACGGQRVEEPSFDEVRDRDLEHPAVAGAGVRQLVVAVVALDSCLADAARSNRLLLRQVGGVGHVDGLPFGSIGGCCMSSCTRGDPIR